MTTATNIAPTWRIDVGDVLDRLAEIDSDSVHCVVTSPPYWGLRDYGTAAWDGGDPDCGHKPRSVLDGCVGCGVPMQNFTDACKFCAERRRMREKRGIPLDRQYVAKDPARPDLPNPPAGWAERDATTKTLPSVCGRCGARRIDQQLGLEPTPALYLERMTAVFREVRRVLRPDGTCWVNMGDGYANDTKWGGSTGGKHANGLHGDTGIGRLKTTTGLKPKDLIGMPWRLAFALQDDGWWLRSEIIWAKPNPMPESVTDRPTKSHEQIFLLTKSARYFYDADAIREPHSREWGNDGGSLSRFGPDEKLISANAHRGNRLPEPNPAGRNARTVWTIATQPYPEAHFATFPEELPRRCILAGTSERGVCPTCGAPWTRVVEREYRSPIVLTGTEEGRYSAGRNRNVTRMGDGVDVTTTGWRSSCDHVFENPSPGTVLDPFAGSGTTILVALQLGRSAIGIELSPTYADLARRRILADHGAVVPLNGDTPAALRGVQGRMAL